MDSVSTEVANRLNALKDQGVIAGWQDAGGHNAGLQKEPLPALIFNEAGDASTFYNEHDLITQVEALETFGYIALNVAARRVYNFNQRHALR